MTATLSTTPDTTQTLDLSQLMRELAKARVDQGTEPTATKKARLESWKKHHLTREQRDKLREIFEAVPDVFAVFDADEPVVLDKTQASLLMEEWTAITEAEVAIKARKDRVKEMVFGSLTLTNELAGVEDPDLQPGEVVVETQGRKFAREGGGRQDPTFDTEVLKEALGDQAKQVFDTVKIPRQVIPARTEEVLNEDRLTGFLARNPELIELVREAIVPGAPKTTRLVVRDVPKSK